MVQPTGIGKYRSGNSGKIFAAEQFIDKCSKRVCCIAAKTANQAAGRACAWYGVTAKAKKNGGSSLWNATALSRTSAARGGRVRLYVLKIRTRPADQPTRSS
jgi:hypothetical protein